MDNLISIGGKYYAIDLEKLISFCSSQGNSAQTITQSYGLNDEGNMSLFNKEVSESKDGYNADMANIRYNTISTLLNLIIAPVSDGSGTIIVTEEMKNMHLGQKLAFNTLVEMEIIYEIEVEE